MKRTGAGWIVLLLVVVMAATVARGQMGPADGHANEVSNVTTYVTDMHATNPHSWYIGHTGTNNTLTIESSGMWRQGTWHSFAIGGDPGSDHNTVTILGTYTNISNAASLSAYVGMDTKGMGGVYNRLLLNGGRFISSGSARYYTLQVGGTASLVRVSNAGVMEIGSLIVGRQEGSASNRFEVTGAFSVGGAGSQNHLIISGEGKVYSSGGGVDIGSSGSAHSNTVTVTGAGSVWSVWDAGQEIGYDGRISVGFNAGSSYNALRVTAGGMVTNSATGTDGLWMGGAAGADYNRVEIDGSESKVYTHGLRIGSRGANNTMRITEGGYLRAAANSYIGWHSSATNNELEIVGPGSEAHFAINLLMGDNSDLGGLEGAGGDARVLVHTGGLLRVDGALLTGTTGNESHLNLVEVDGAGASALIGSELTLGSGPMGRSNVLRVANGAYLETGAAGLTIGADGSYNQAFFESGAAVRSVDTTIGAGAASVDNALLLGAGTVWTNTGTISLSPAGGSGNAMLIENGATLRTEHLFVGSNAVLGVQGGSLTYEGMFNVLQGGTLTGVGTITQGGSADGAEIAGTLSPGNSAGTITFDGDLVLKTTSTVQIELGGTTPGTDSDLIIANYLTIEGGSLVFSLLDG